MEGMEINDLVKKLFGLKNFLVKPCSGLTRGPFNFKSRPDFSINRPGNSPYFRLIFLENFPKKNGPGSVF